MKPPEFFFEPVPHEEAIDFIKSKPVVSRDVFDRLLPELKARAFVVAGVEVASVVQRVRDEIATLPAGGDWKQIRKQIAEEIHPYLADPDEPENTAAAERRAELLIRTHGFQAYQAANVATMRRQADVLPYWQYLSMQDGRVRASHRALEGKVLPADHSFWKDHTPPWEWGCRCQIVPLSHDDVDDLNKADEGKAPEAHRVLPPHVLDELERTGHLVTGPSMISDVRSPVAKGIPGAFSWDPASLTLPLDQLKARYDAPVWASFEQWAKQASIPDLHLTVWEWISGQRTIAPTASVSLPIAQHQTIDQILGSLGLDKKVTWEAGDVLAMRAALVKTAPLTTSDLVTSIGGNGLKSKGVGSEAWVKKQINEILSFLPRDIALALPKVSIQIVKSIGGSYGDFDPSTNVLRVARQTILSGLGGEAQLHETLWHETMHWIHMKGPQTYRDAIQKHFRERTLSSPLKRMANYGGVGRRDEWWDEYAGKQYTGAVFDPDHEGAGIELPTRYFQLLANPDKLVRQMDPILAPHAGKFLETLKIVLSIFQS